MKADDVFTALVLVVLLGMGIRNLPWQKLRMLGARSWPTSQGRVESTTVIVQNARYFNYYIVQLAYSYSASGEYYSGFYQKMYLRESSAQKFADTAKGLPVFIRHSEKSPDLSNPPP